MSCAVISHVVQICAAELVCLLNSSAGRYHYFRNGNNHILFRSERNFVNPLVTLGLWEAGPLAQGKNQNQKTKPDAMLWHVVAAADYTLLASEEIVYWVHKHRSEVNLQLILYLNKQWIHNWLFSQWVSWESMLQRWLLPIDVTLK